MTKPLIQCQQVSKQFIDGGLKTEVLNDIDLTINAGDSIAIVGSSGSGKSTLLHLLGALDKPSNGQIDIMGQNIATLSEKALGQLRNKHLGFVYQFHHLLPEFTAAENVAIPLVIAGNSPKIAKQQAESLLSRVGLAHRLQHKPTELSGGERQRAALARALITKPDVLLADEPTGNLDQRTAKTVFDLMLELNQDFGTALVIVTHDSQLATQLSTRLTIQQGHLSPNN